MAFGKRHQKPTSALVNDLAVVASAAGGAALFSCSSDHTIRKWRLDWGVEVQTLRGHTDSGNCLALSARCGPAWRFSGSSDKSIRCWCVERGRELAVVQAHEGAVTAIALASNPYQTRFSAFRCYLSRNLHGFVSPGDWSLLHQYLAVDPVYSAVWGRANTVMWRR